MRLIAAVLTGVLLSGGALADEKKFMAVIKFCPTAAQDCISIVWSEPLDEKACVDRAAKMADDRIEIAVEAGLFGIPLTWSTHCVPVGPEERKA